MNEPSSSRQFNWISYFTGWLAINLSLALFLLLALVIPYPGFLTATGFLILWWGGMFITRKFPKIPYGVFLWTMPFMFVMSMWGNEYFLLPLKQPLVLESPDDITRFRNHRVWTIAKAVPRAEYFRYVEWPWKGKVHFRGIAPIVSADWEPTQPVKLWAVCHVAFYASESNNWIPYVNETCVPSWYGPQPINVVSASNDGEEAYEDVITEIEKTHGLKSAPDAVFAEVGVNLDQEAKFYEKIAMRTLGIAQLGWILGYPLIQFIRGRRKNVNNYPF